MILSNIKKKIIFQSFKIDINLNNLFPSILMGDKLAVEVLIICY